MSTTTLTEVGRIQSLESDMGKKKRYNGKMKFQSQTSSPKSYQVSTSYPNASSTPSQKQDIFNERRDTLVVPKSLDLEAIPGPSGDMIRRLDAQGKLIKLDYIYSPSIVRH